MKTRQESGFSLVELLIVCAIIALIAALAIPFLQKAVRATENGNTFATMRTIHSSQVGFYQGHGRWGRLTELNNLLGNGLGTPSGNEINRGRFVLMMEPGSPTDAQLKDRYTIKAVRDVTGEGQRYIYEISESGEIVQIEP
jgi:prepilin-type N-terminal cleavage/methylation domain-containing protein